MLPAPIGVKCQFLFLSARFSPLPNSTQPSTDRLITIIATYNERNNLPDLVQRLRQQTPEMTILVIDDNSPDGTGQWCRQRAAEDPLFCCIHRSGKLGLGSATVEGFKYAMQNRFDLIATMDADFSHDPDRLPALVEVLMNDSHRKIGIAIGSRYVAGGEIKGWPWQRHLCSRMVNVFARVFLRLPTRDNSGAFRVYRNTTIGSIGIDKIQSDGYAYLEEILWRTHQLGIAMVEVPITFIDRTEGQSKTNLSQGVQVFWHLTKIAVGIVR
jgi:dolichol-phosphate mannosyltransferase